jgi:hypothetical protein
MKRTYILAGVLVLVILSVIFKPYLQIAAAPVVRKFTKAKTVAQRLEQYGDVARSRLKPFFEKARVSYPPQRVTLVGLKGERILQIYATDSTSAWRFIHSYPIRAASGKLGPKLREGDNQVPEGVYPIESLNPNSTFHLSLRVGYPNDFDRAQATKDGRRTLGGDIMIHGSFVSAGCLAMGDKVAEDLFVLAADTGLSNITAIITPADFRTGKSIPKSDRLPAWSESLYSQIKSRLAELPLETK